MKLYVEDDVDTRALEGARIAVLGYGSQGRAHALNLRDSGVKVVVAQRPGRAHDIADEHRGGGIHEEKPHHKTREDPLSQFS